MRVPTHLDRYPAKMVSKLADRLVDEFASRGTSVLDPFCGSGAVLRAAHNRGLRVTGVDLNPLAELYCSVKLDSFDVSTSTMLARRWIDAAKSESLQHAPERKDLSYWFTPATLRKLEALRLRGQRLELRRRQRRQGFATCVRVGSQTLLTGSPKKPEAVHLQDREGHARREALRPIYHRSATAVRACDYLWRQTAEWTLDVPQPRYPTSKCGRPVSRSLPRDHVSSLH